MQHFVRQRIRDVEAESAPDGDSVKGVRGLLRVARAAVAALLVCLPMLLETRPRTPLRVFCIAAFEYLARLRGGTLGRRRRVAIAHACDFGSLRDEYYDEQKLNRTEYRLLRSELREIAPERATVRYIRELRKAERGRPMFSGSATGVSAAITEYRGAVIELSLRWMQRISGLPLEGVTFQGLVSLVCLIQLADDLLDWKEDLAARCPSYVTAFLLEPSGKGIGRALRTQADGLLRRTVNAARQDIGAVLFGIAGVATWVFVVALLKVRLPK